MSATSSLKPTELHFTTNGTATAVKLTATADKLTFNANDGTAVALRNIKTPEESGDAANKAYVDGVAQGLDIKASVRVATTSDGPQLDAITVGTVVDGITLDNGDRILIKHEPVRWRPRT